MVKVMDGLCKVSGAGGRGGASWLLMSTELPGGGSKCW